MWPLGFLNWIVLYLLSVETEREAADVVWVAMITVLPLCPATNVTTNLWGNLFK